MPLYFSPKEEIENRAVTPIISHRTETDQTLVGWMADIWYSSGLFIHYLCRYDSVSLARFDVYKAELSAVTCVKTDLSICFPTFTTSWGHFFPS